MATYDMNFTASMNPFNLLCRTHFVKSTKTRSRHHTEDIIFVCFWLMLPFQCNDYFICVKSLALVENITFQKSYWLLPPCYDYLFAWTSVYVFMRTIYQNIKKSATESKFHLITASTNDIQYYFYNYNYINIQIYCTASHKSTDTLILISTRCYTAIANLIHHFNKLCTGLNPLFPFRLLYVIC